MIIIVIIIVIISVIIIFVIISSNSSTLLIAATWVLFLRIVSDEISKVSASERRNNACNVISHWLRPCHVVYFWGNLYEKG